MEKVKICYPVKIITGFIFNNIEIFDKTYALLSKQLGPIDLESELLLFNHTDYYNNEMCEGLKMKFLSFQKLKNFKNIYKLKIFTQKIEDKLSIYGKRRINIDPGYLTLGKLVLLTTKDYSHRIHLKNGIYAEVTLFFKDRSYHPWEWTYPDYKSDSYINFFNRAREAYIKDLK